MEEILASIRRIISDEVAAEPQAARSENPSAEPAGARVVPDAMGEPASAPAVTSFASNAAPRGAFDDAEAGGAVDLPRRATPAARPIGAPRPPNVSSGYAPVGRAPAADPFRSGRRPAAAAAQTVPASRVALAAAPVERQSIIARQPAVEAVDAELTTDEADLGTSLSAALLDLSLVEQAVQAELATMTVDAALEMATADTQPADAGSAPAIEVATSPSVPDHPPAELSAVAPLPAPSVPETDDMQVQAKPAPVPSRAAGAEPVDERRSAEPRAAEAPKPEPRFLPAAARASVAAEAPAPAPPEAPGRLVSTATNTAVSTAFGTLARTMSSNSRTVDDLVTEAMRPMLKAWLDENLPALVERLVRAEIERVARQGL